MGLEASKIGSGSAALVRRRAWEGDTSVPRRELDCMGQWIMRCGTCRLRFHCYRYYGVLDTLVSTRPTDEQRVTH